jgi:hypothetical protein
MAVGEGSVVSLRLIAYDMPRSSFARHVRRMVSTILGLSAMVALSSCAPARSTGTAATAIPDRARAARGATSVLARIDTLVRAPREAVIQRELLAGNIPSFLRTLHTVRDSATTSDGRVHVIEYDVMPDYLAIGDDADFVRMPMTPHTAQVFAEAYGYVLPTRRMVNAIWRAATVKLEPQPLTEAREASGSFLQHHRLIEAQLVGATRRALIAGIKKDVVVSNRLLERANRVAIYGWHHQNGVPIQPLYVGHVDWYVDYSHGIRLVRRTMRVDGAPMSFEQIATHPVLHVLVSDEGALETTRADGELRFGFTTGGELREGNYGRGTTGGELREGNYGRGTTGG